MLHLLEDGLALPLWRVGALLPGGGVADLLGQLDTHLEQEQEQEHPELPADWNFSRIWELFRSFFGAFSELGSSPQICTMR